MAEVASAYVSLLPSAKGFGPAIQKQVGGEIDEAGKKVGSRFGTAIKAGILGAGALAGGFLTKAVGAAGQLEQSVGAIDAVFGKSAGQMDQWSQGAAQSVGLTRNEFNELGTLIGSQLKNGGTAMDQLAPKTKDLIGLGADLSSMFGGSTKEAVEALSSALKGERDPIEKYGVSLTQSKLDAEAAALGFKKVGGSFGQQAQQAATLSLIMKQTGDAQGNFAKESDTLAGKQQILKAQLGNLTTTVGGALLPAITKVTGAVSGFVGGMQNGTGAGGAFAAVAGTIARNFGTIAPVLGIVVGGLIAYRAAMAVSAAITAIQTAGTIGATGAQWSLNAALRANPIGLVITALTGLAVGLFFAWKKSETFRSIVTGAFNAVRAAVSSVVGWFKSFVPGAFAAVVGAVRAYVATYKAVVSAAFNAVKAGVSSATGAMSAAVGGVGGAFAAAGRKVGEFATAVGNKIGEALGFIRGLPGKITAALGDLSGILVNAGQQLIQGLINGITAKLGALKDKMGDVAGAIGGFLPGSPIKEGPLVSWNRGAAGKRLMDMLASGITADPLRSAMGGALQPIADPRMYKPISIPRAPGLAFDDGGLGGVGSDGRVVLEQHNNFPSSGHAEAAIAHANTLLLESLSAIGVTR